MTEYVVLVNENNKPVGKADKNSIHSANTPLHRAFSLFLFNKSGQLLLQQRSSKKKTFPLMWSNSCCGHPKPGESYKNAIRRRLKHELGIVNLSLYKILPYFKYKAEMNGIIENEYCPVFAGLLNSNVEVSINKNEVENTEWISWEEFVKRVKNNNSEISLWSKLETKELLKSEKFRMLLSNKTRE